MTSSPTVRAATKKDAAACARIYAHYVLNTAHTFEETPPPPEEFAERINRANSERPFLCAESEGEVYGYSYADIWRTRCGYRYTAETSVYVDAQKPRRGAGKSLMQELLARLAKTQTRKAVAIISLPNPASVALHEKLGFASCGAFPGIGWKFNAEHDVGFWLYDFEKPAGK